MIELKRVDINTIKIYDGFECFIVVFHVDSEESDPAKVINIYNIYKIKLRFDIFKVMVSILLSVMKLT